jgi:hypothetical protein
VVVLHCHCPCSGAQHVEQVEHPGDVVLPDFVSRIALAFQFLLQTINQFEQPLPVQPEFGMDLRQLGGEQIRYLPLIDDLHQQSVVAGFAFFPFEGDFQQFGIDQPLDFFLDPRIEAGRQFSNQLRHCKMIAVASIKSLKI